MKQQKQALVLGNEACALGALHAGISGVYAYPGTPSTEVTEYIQKSPLATEGNVYSRWCTNEKTAMEAALGMSYVGKRALVCMKHVGLNVAADAFVNSAVAGINGGVVVLVADDPSMHSSQNEQDSRFYGKFALIPMLEPSTQQEAYDMMSYAYELSEKIGLPVLLRLVTRLAHSRAVVNTKNILPQNELHYPKEPRNWVLLPVIARRRYDILVKQQADLETSAYNSPFNKYNEGEKMKMGIVASGIAANYVMEAFKGDCPYSFFKVSQYPLSRKFIQKMQAECDEILVIEDGQPFIEDQINGLLQTNYKVRGRLTGDLPRTGELTPDNVRAALGFETQQVYEESNTVVGRPPALCKGCGHRSVYNALNIVTKEYPNAKIFSDIGCYTLGALPPFSAIDSCIDMGASITMAKGAADAGQFPAISVIGDSTFTHSGMTGLLDAVNAKANITVIISDNLTTAMTGGQDSAGTNKFEAICRGIGVEEEHLHVVIPLPKNMDEITNVIRQEIEYKGVSVIIPRRDCVQQLNRKLKQKKAAK